jgi:hypothetical protein
VCPTRAKRTICTMEDIRAVHTSRETAALQQSQPAGTVLAAIRHVDNNEYHEKVYVKMEVIRNTAGEPVRIRLEANVKVWVGQRQTTACDYAGSRAALPSNPSEAGQALANQPRICMGLNRGSAERAEAMQTSAMNDLARAIMPQQARNEFIRRWSAENFSYLRPAFQASGATTRPNDPPVIKLDSFLADQQTRVSPPVQSSGGSTFVVARIARVQQYSIERERLANSTKIEWDYRGSL